MGTVFVKASSRARAYVRGTRSKLARASMTLKLSKQRMVAGHAYGQMKTAGYHPMSSVAGHPAHAKLVRKATRYRKLRKLAGY